MLIETNRFLLRKLTLGDVTERYLNWLRNQDSQKWIFTANSTLNIEDLKAYVLKRIEKEDILFLGIYQKESNLHIGNIKFEPIIKKEGRAELGILIGDPNFRGKKVFGEVLEGASLVLKQYYNINQITLGVSRQNQAAFKAYLNAGFIEEIEHNTHRNSNMVRMKLII